MSVFVINHRSEKVQQMAFVIILYWYSVDHFRDINRYFFHQIFIINDLLIMTEKFRQQNESLAVISCLQVSKLLRPYIIETQSVQKQFRHVLILSVVIKTSTGLTLPMIWCDVITFLFNMIKNLIFHMNHLTFSLTEWLCQ